MRAAYVTEPGPATTIRHGDLPVPTPGPGEVLVRVAATAVNPVDTFVRSGAWRTPFPSPFVIGRDLVGTVAATAHGYATGDAVWCNSLGHAGRQGAAATYAAVPADRLYRLPAGVDPIAAVAILHPAATAWLALFRHARLQAGETVYVAGGGGNVGSALIELAAGAGTRVVASASAGDLDFCRDKGAAVAIDYRAPEQVDPVDVHIDTSGHHDLDAAVGMLAFGGRLVLMAGLRERPALPVGALYTRDASIVGFAISNAAVADLAAAAEGINDALSLGRLVPRSVDRRPLAQAGQAHLDVEQGRTHGRRIVLIPE
jgi:NADPH:quinone reductase-like Zn-dependent oxidoreductase